MTLTLDRREVCKILSALTAAENVSDNTEFCAIHDKLKKQLDGWDEKQSKPKGGSKNA